MRPRSTAERGATLPPWFAASGRLGRDALAILRSTWAPLAAIGVVGLVGWGLARGCFADSACVRWSTRGAAGVLALLFLVSPPTVLAVLSLPFTELADRWRQALALVSMALPWVRRRRARLLARGGFILLLRRFKRRSEQQVADLLRSRPPIGIDVLTRQPWTGGMNADRGQLAGLFRSVRTPIVTLLNAEFHARAPEWVYNVPVDPPQWKRAVADCMRRAAGVLVLGTEVTESIAYELTEAATLEPGRVLLLLDLEPGDLDRSRGPDERHPQERRSSQERARAWVECCPPALHNRIFALGAPDIGARVAAWLRACGNQERSAPTSLP